MPITLNKIASNIANVSFVWGDDTVNIVYYPGHITEKTFAELQSFSTTDVTSIISGFETFNEILVSLIKSWDVFDDEAQKVMFPLEVSRLAELPISFRSQVLTSIMEDIRPNQPAAKKMS